MSLPKLGKVLGFEWDEGNEEKNWLKHKVLPKEAEDIFYYSKRLLLEDIKHSEREPRFILIGKTKQGRMLFIVFTRRINKIRVVSCRDANRKEEDFYEKTINTAKVQK